jgi:hypothetical protein
MLLSFEHINIHTYNICVFYMPYIPFITTIYTIIPTYYTNDAYTHTHTYTHIYTYTYSLQVP